MNTKRPDIIIEDPWKQLKDYTKARIAMGRCGSSIPTKELLDFRLAHAKAIDAVHIPLNTVDLVSELEKIVREHVFVVHSKAENRDVYLKRPDLGRKLSSDSVELLNSIPINSNYDIALVVSDGLSATAIKRNIIPFFNLLYPELNKSYSLSPVVIAKQARVAIGDEIASLFNAKLVVNIIGERPGLKSPDSMGIYMTYNPSVGITDEKRNCISNIRKDGLSYELACSKLLYLISESIKKGISGVDLKDEQDSNSLK